MCVFLCIYIYILAVGLETHQRVKHALKSITMAMRLWIMRGTLEPSPRGLQTLVTLECRSLQV